jgi:hypothetical protein
MRLASVSLIYRNEPESGGGEFGMRLVIAYVISGTAAAGAVTPVDTLTHKANSSIVIGGGAQSIVVTPNGKTAPPVT